MGHRIEKDLSMAMERTLSIIKPDGVKRKLIGKIIDHLEKAGFNIDAMTLKHLTREETEGFYQEHKRKPFFKGLVDYMASAPVVLIALSGENVITEYRQLLGHTDPQKAEEGTLRKKFSLSMQQNTLHGSDSPQAAEREIKYFFDFSSD